MRRASPQTPRRRRRPPAAPRAGCRAAPAARRPSRRDGCRRAWCGSRCSRRCSARAPPVRVPDEPAVDRAEGELAARGARARAVDVVEQPAQLGAGEIGVDHEPGLARDASARMPRCSELVAHAARCGGPATRSRCAIGRPVARSHTTVVSRWLVMPIAAMSRAVDVRLGERLVQHAGLRRPDLRRIVLDPARLRKDLAELLLRRTRGWCRPCRTGWRGSWWCPGPGPARTTCSPPVAAPCGRSVKLRVFRILAIRARAPHEHPPANLQAPP